uniref:Wu:fj29h11 n=1 Tax=Oncorhynchus mykiss TaxID=8022 RepID=A0A8C7R4M3_ONCMY
VAKGRKDQGGRILSQGTVSVCLNRLRREVLLMLGAFPGGVEVPKLCACYKQMYGRQLTLREYGLTGLQELFAALGDQVCVERQDKMNLVRLSSPGDQVEYTQPHILTKISETTFFSFKVTIVTGPLTLSQMFLVFASKMTFMCVCVFVCVCVCVCVCALVMSEAEKAQRNILSLVEQHPEGIPLKKLTVAYSQMYHCNLTLSSLGFSSTSSLVASLEGELYVDKDLVFHRNHRGVAAAPAQAGGDQVDISRRPRSGKDPPSRTLSPRAVPLKTHPQSTTPISFGSGSDPLQPAPGSRYGPPPSSGSSLGATCPSIPPSAVPRSSPLLSFSSTVKENEEVTREELLDRVKEVIKVYPPAATTIAQLQNGYLLRFGKQLPLQQYRSLYDNHEKQPAAACALVVPGKTGAEKPAGRETIITHNDQVRFKTRSPLLQTTSPVPSSSPQLAVGQREGNSPVFREAYNAQLREVHGANVRAVEAQAEEEEEEDGMRRKRKKALDPEAVNSLVEDVIRDIAAEGELVTREKVISRVCMLMQVRTLEAGRIDLRWQIPALKDLQRNLREINMFIESAEAVTAMCTLYELGQNLAGLKNKKRFEELNLGPLCKLPLIHRMFKIDSNTKDEDIHQIETVDILRSLRVFRRKQNKPKVDLAEFMKHLSDQYSCDSPYELGIRIHSVGLPIATLQKAVSSEHVCMERAREAIQRELEEEVGERMRKMKRVVMEGAQGPVLFSSVGSAELRKKYVTMTAADAVLEVFTNASGVFNPKMTKSVQDFMLRVSADRLARALFQLAICGGSLAAPQDLVPKEKPARHTQERRAEEKTQATPPSEATVKQVLMESLSNHSSPFTLAHVASLERKLAKHFQVTEFTSLEQGSFLEFLVKHAQVLQETVGSAVVVGSTSGGGGQDWQGQGCGFRPNRQDVFEFIKQCGTTSLSHVEWCLRAHYGVRDSRDLGLGPLRTLVGLVQRQRELSLGGGLSHVLYEAALLPRDTSSSVGEAQQTVGILGEVSQTQALSCLLSCPLLDELGQWSQWELVFRPRHGPLKDFIDRNAASTDLSALEVSPGVLLRVTTSTGDKLFSQAAMTLDPVGTAGHLVSMVVADGTANAPTALLANHMESSLAAAVAKEDLSRAEEDGSCFSSVALFLLDCLIRIPTRTCRALLQQVFLEPFSRVLGGQAKSKAVLLSTARSNLHHLNCLHQLGIVLGITDWVKDYHTKLSPPQNQDLSQNQAQTPPADQTKVRTGEITISDGDDDDELYELTSETLGDTHTERDGDEAWKEGKSLAEPEKADNSEFGIGVELNEEGQRLMTVHQERLGRSLDRLSTELYSKDTHFVLELIQNADDNSYPTEGGPVPALAFVVEKDCVTVLNNETGFQEKNIRAICDVGRSTKGKHKYGYIGQKGIGFKSVFKVTDCPEIHSNGFHLCFDKTSGPMGYILPHWVDDERPLNTHLEKRHAWTTKICLPLRSECYQTRNLFHDVHPSLLLFLHRLRSITIYNQELTSDWTRMVTMTRRDLSHSVLEVEHTEGTERWLVVKHTLHPTKIKDEVESTELALAFQLGDDLTGSDIQAPPQKQPVFAFLPLRSFGFRFIIQGDFDIPSSREDVDRDSSWNQWLRSEIPQLFLRAMDVFSDHPEFSGLKGLCHFLQFVPLPDEVLDFFKPVAGQIIQLLKGKAFLPTLNTDGSVVYRLPSQVAVCQDPVIRDVIGAEELNRHLSLSYLHPGLLPVPPLSLLTHLGVRRLRGSDVTTVTTAMAKELLQGDGLRHLARLLVCNFRALEQGYGETDSILTTLRDLPIIPLADGRMVALSGEGVFFPMTETKNHNNTALYRDVCVVHPSLLSCVEPLESQQIRELLRRLGVHELEPQQLLENHIYPALKNNTWKSKPVEAVVSYLVFIKQHSSPQEYTHPDTVVPVLTTRGLLFPADHKVHFSTHYGNMDLPNKLPGVDWVLLSGCYVETDGDVEGWRDLFIRLGVRERLILRKERRTLTSKELASSPWAVESELWPCRAGRAGGPEEGCVLDDYPCEELLSLVTAQLPAPVLMEQRQALLELLETNWDTGDRYSQYLTAQVIDSEGRLIKSTKSSFFHFLSCLPWVPAYCLQAGAEGGRKAEYLCPNSVYLYSPEVHNLLGTHVSYIDMTPSEFTRTLGMKTSVNVEELIGYLKKWCVKTSSASGPEGQEKQEEEGSEFSSTVQHVHSVYSFLHKNCSQTNLKELFQHTPAVFIEYNRNGDWCSGRFYHLKEVCWNDPTEMFVRYRELTRGADSTVQEPRVLAPFYSKLDDMKDLFKRLLTVELTPSMLQYVVLLELVCNSCPVPTVDVLRDVSKLYARLADKCKTPGQGEQEQNLSINPRYCSTLKGMLLDKRVFPTKDNSWVTLAHRPMIPDSKELEKIFKAHKQVCLLNLPLPEKRPYMEKLWIYRMLFLEICGVRLLSKCVSTEAQTENYRPCPSMQRLVRSVVPYIQRFLYHHEDLQELYWELKKNNIRQTIRQLTYGQVGMLYTRYLLSVSDEEDPVVEMEDVICLLKDNKELYIQKDHLSARLDICRELVKLFSFESSHRKELVHFLSGLMTSLPDNAALKRFLQKECPGELPSEEEAWEVPQPVLPVQPIPGNVSCTDQCDYTHRNIMTEDMEVNCRHSLLELLSSNSSGITEGVVSSMFQGASQRPPLALDSPVWAKPLHPQALLEDLQLECQRPSTVLFSDDQRDTVAIGEWGEKLVFSFLCHWRDSQGEEVFVEVKSTVKKDRAFIHLSANELDFALREKERYHVFRVYNAGDSEKVRLCRIQNLAQHLHAKDLELFLFV